MIFSSIPSISIYNGHRYQYYVACICQNAAFLTIILIRNLYA